MTDEISRLGIAVDSSDAKTAARDLNQLASAAENAEGKAKELSGSSKDAGGSLDRLAGLAKKASGESKSLAQSQRDADRASGTLSGSIKTLAATVTAYISAKQIIEYAESWTTLENRLKTVTKTNDDLQFSLSAVFQIAQDSRAPLSTTAELYQRIQTNADALSLSGAEVSRVVETISKSLAISGTSAAGADAAMVQLGQAFASGTLRGEELNSVLEQAPALAKALADGMGVTVGELRNLGQEGKLSADTVIAALQSQAGVIDSTFSDLEPTVGQSITLINNSLTKFVGELDDATGGSNVLARSIQNLSQYIDSGSLLDGVVRQMEIWNELITSTSGGVEGLQNELQLLKDIGGGSVDFLSDAFQELPVNIKAFIQSLTVEVAYGFDYIGTLAEEFADKVKAVFGDETFDEVEERYKSAFAGIAEARQSSIQTILDEREQTLANADAAVDAIRKEREERQLAYEERLAQAEGLGESKSSQIITGPTQDQLKENLERVRQQLYTEEEQIAASFVRRQESLAQYLSSNAGFQDQYNLLTLANVEMFNDQMVSLEEKRNKEAKRINDKKRKEEERAEKDSQKKRLIAMNVYSQLASSIIYAAFGESKDARRAQALISTYTGAANALAEVPYPYNFPAAAAVAIAGLKNVTEIESTNIGSGGGGYTGSSPPGTIGSTSFNTPVISQPFPEEQEYRPIINIYNPVGLDEEILAEKINDLYQRDYIQATGTR